LRATAAAQVLGWSGSGKSAELFGAYGDKQSSFEPGRQSNIIEYATIIARRQTDKTCAYKDGRQDGVWAF
jgi:hypothetical protein